MFLSLSPRLQTQVRQVKHEVVIGKVRLKLPFTPCTTPSFFSFYISSSLFSVSSLSLIVFHPYICPQLWLHDLLIFQFSHWFVSFENPSFQRSALQNSDWENIKLQSGKSFLHELYALSPLPRLSTKPSPRLHCSLPLRFSQLPFTLLFPSPTLPRSLQLRSSSLSDTNLQFSSSQYEPLLASFLEKVMLSFRLRLDLPFISYLLLFILQLHRSAPFSPSSYITLFPASVLKIISLLIFLFHCHLTSSIRPILIMLPLDNFKFYMWFLTWKPFPHFFMCPLFNVYITPFSPLLLPFSFIGA